MSFNHKYPDYQDSMIQVLRLQGGERYKSSPRTGGRPCPPLVTKVIEEFSYGQGGGTFTRLWTTLVRVTPLYENKGSLSGLGSTQEVWNASLPRHRRFDLGTGRATPGQTE
jgi:hypothetical protein